MLVALVNDSVRAFEKLGISLYIIGDFSSNFFGLVIRPIIRLDRYIESKIKYETLISLNIALVTVRTNKGLAKWVKAIR